MSARVDGNALAGMLSAYFRLDTTTAIVQCTGCGTRAALARELVYPDPMGFVVRCEHCADVLMIVVERPGGARLDLRGVDGVEFEA
jgi:hypothetical protein